MGLDLVELVIQTEETFAFTIHNHEAEKVQTVGDLYRLVLAKLEIPYEPARLDAPYRHWQFSPPNPWTAPAVWGTLRHIITEQLQVEEDEVREEAHFQNDLGAD
jgi:acyl carrier protein